MGTQTQQDQRENPGSAERLIDHARACQVAALEMAPHVSRVASAFAFIAPALITASPAIVALAQVSPSIVALNKAINAHTIQTARVPNFLS